MFEHANYLDQPDHFKLIICSISQADFDALANANQIAVLCNYAVKLLDTRDLHELMDDEQRAVMSAISKAAKHLINSFVN